jgi:hypothetical protein
MEITQLWKQPRCPTTDEWIKNMWYIHTVRFYSSIRNNDTLWFESKWMKLEDIMLSEVRERQSPHDFSHMRKRDPKDKHIHTNKHDHIQTHM